MLDPLGCHQALPFVYRCYPLGYPLEIATNSEDVIAAAEENWGVFAAAFDVDPMRVRIAVSHDGGGERPDSPTFRAMGHLMSIICDRTNFAVCDLQSGFAFCRLSASVARDQTWMRQRFLDGMVYCMLVCREVTPIHASCVAKDGRGVLLCGHSGAGKSSLAYACTRRGWTFVTDDVAYLQRTAADRVVLGKPLYLKFLKSASELFPELRGLPVITDAAGEPALELAMSGIRTSFHTPIHAIAFLNRVEGSTPIFAPIQALEALDRLMGDMPSFGDAVYALHRESIDILVQTTKLAAFHYWELEAAVGALETFTRG